MSQVSLQSPRKIVVFANAISLTNSDDHFHLNFGGLQVEIKNTWHLLLMINVDTVVWYGVSVGVLFHVTRSISTRRPASFDYYLLN